MTRRVAALFAMIGFATAWLVGVFCGHSPLTRLENAVLALGAGLLVGLGVGVALERIVLARLAGDWEPPAAAPDEVTKGATDATDVEHGVPSEPAAATGATPVALAATKGANANARAMSEASR